MEFTYTHTRTHLFTCIQKKSVGSFEEYFGLFTFRANTDLFLNYQAEKTNTYIFYLFFLITSSGDFNEQRNDQYASERDTVCFHIVVRMFLE